MGHGRSNLSSPPGRGARPVSPQHAVQLMRLEADGCWLLRGCHLEIASPSSTHPRWPDVLSRRPAYGAGGA